MPHAVTVAGRPATPEELAVLEAIERTGNPSDSHLGPVKIAEAMIWLANVDAPLVAVERLPHPNADRRAWADYAARLRLDPGGRKLDIDQLRQLIGDHRLWTTTIPAEGKAAA